MIYIDEYFHCHTTNPDGMFRSFNVPSFDDKCATFIEGYIYVPPYEVYKLEDGVSLQGETIAPWKPYNELDAAQREYERQLLNEYKESLLELGVEV